MPVDGLAQLTRAESKSSSQVRQMHPNYLRPEDVCLVATGVT